MMKLNYSSGNVISPKVHEIGILAVGSHLENHGAALPIDTDSKIAAHLALQAALRSGAKFLGILYAATEYDYVKHGIHIDTETLARKRLLPTLKSAKKCLNIKKVVLVNGHGGNIPLLDYIEEIENKLNIQIIFNNKIVEIEGPHAGTGEISMASILGFLDKSKLDEHCDFQKYPEVGMVGLKEARSVNSDINESAELLENEGVCIDEDLGNSLIKESVESIIEDIKKILY
ncbi:2-amino-5-formylamino-6-ribosylaminopyrimidin-4(3H)-one 5'-monophosphate deformylase [Methanobacterium sp. ACI-7]|uniref:2-amino-5-formylamino-6-ribosylaminopyrimidin- 4(3H)-one 5'-monophosphate deformylase n=1 Tax=unclassified Methanobacterium TaxID=2627676 RepID=UPI0039C32282